MILGARLEVWLLGSRVVHEPAPLWRSLANLLATGDLEIPAVEERCGPSALAAAAAAVVGSVAETLPEETGPAGVTTSTPPPAAGGAGSSRVASRELARGPFRFALSAAARPRHHPLESALDFELRAADLRLVRSPEELHANWRLRVRRELASVPARRDARRSLEEAAAAVLSELEAALRRALPVGRIVRETWRERRPPVRARAVTPGSPVAAALFGDVVLEALASIAAETPEVAFPADDAGGGIFDALNGEESFSSGDAAGADFGAGGDDTGGGQI